ncbi:MAG TPA: winged helix-turn-helix domain-containing protein [Phycisphaerae bacterium]|nr:winged helix-turn-helix domain-containing protein [Phycisphaerales bacterium]HPF38734.1 winged helix-turn-helix domain-containing protein [Phycisphaerae bacterium]HRW52888.1 winged helix-turn-helix domain-containing protein [Phycisphaerae bacterium]
MTTKKTNKKAGKKSESARRAPTNTTKASSVSKHLTTKRRRPESEKHPSGLDLAADVLVKSGTPLNARTIAERVIAAGWKTSGLTPWATLYSAIQREIDKKGKESRFKKVGRGLFEFQKQSEAK